MLKKTLLSLAITASTAGLTACNISSIDNNDEVNSKPLTSGQSAANGGTAANNTLPIFDPASKDALGIPKMPLITDLLFSGTPDTDGADGTIPFPAGNKQLGDDGYNPIFSAFADMDGFSTAAAIDIPFTAELDQSSIHVSGPNQNVFLVPLSYRNDPITGGVSKDGKEPALEKGAEATISAIPFDFANIPAITATAVSYSDSGSDAKDVLRIYPNTPLKGATRYLVVVTNGIKDSNARNVIAPTVIGAIASGVTPVVGSAGALGGAVRNWLDLAEGFFGNSPTVDPAVKQLDATNVVYTTTFTTGGTTEVLSAMAAPHLALGVNAIAQTLPAHLRYLVETRLVAGDDDTEAATALATAVTTAGGSMTAEKAGGAVLLARHLPQPAPRVATFNKTEVGLNTLGFPTPAGVNIANGSIKLPYYLSAPDTSSVAALATTGIRSFANFWKADDTLGTDFAALLSNLKLTADDVSPPSTNVTRFFPLAKTGIHTNETNPMGYVNVPISVIYSNLGCDGTNATGKRYKPVIYQHGITSSRLSAVGFGAQMIAGDPCIATIAIDLPMHGWVADSAFEQALLGTLYTTPTDSGDIAFDLNGDAVVNGTDNVIFGTLQQRHFALTQSSAGTPRSIFVTANEAPTLDAGADLDQDGTPDGTANDGIYDLAKSGSLYINIANFQNTRDNNRQAVMDLLNLNASLAFLDFDSTNAGADIDLSEVYFAGHSLGAITGTTFLAVNNSLASPAGSGYLNQIKGSVLANGGGQLTKLLENSPAFSSTILNGFKKLGESAGLNLEQGSKLLETTMAVFQGTVDSSDPVNFGGMLGATQAGGILSFEIVGDGTASSPSDTVVPNNATTTLVEIDGDANNDELASTSRSALAGSTKLNSLMGLTATSSTITDEDTPIRTVVQFVDGTHGSFGSGTDGNTTPIDLAGAYGPITDVNGEMMNQVRSFISAGGEAVTIVATPLIKEVE